MLTTSTVTPPQDRLQITLLGPPQVLWAGQVLPVPRRNVRALLYYLAVQSKPVSRAKICLLFWPDIAEAEARRNLTRLLTHLRMALPVPEALITDEGRVSLDGQLVWCDAAEFSRLEAGEQSTQVLQRCAELYTGPFLTGFYLPDCLEYDNWLSQQQADFETHYLAVLSGLIEKDITGREYNGAIGYARRYLEIDCLAEEVHRRLIALYALVGDRSRALRQYEACIAVLENELGAKPLPETQAVYQAVLGGKQPVLKPEPVDVVYPDSVKSLRLDIPLVGRSNAINYLNQLKDRVKVGKSRIVLISGEAGIGKSRLMYEFASRRSLQFQVLFGGGQPGERAVPYHPVVEALRSFPLNNSISLAPLWLAEISRLMPELIDLYPDLPPPFSLRGEEARVRLFDALCRYLFAIQEATGPVLLCLDDLHWFDPTSLSWLMHLCHHLPAKNHQVLVIATYRSEDTERLQELHQNLARMDLVDEIKLEGLEPNSILELVEHVLGTGSGRQSIAERLKEATGGNPFFIQETLQALSEEGKFQDSPEDLEEIPLPASVRAAVERRIGRLNPKSRQVLEAGAVLSSGIHFKTLQVTAGRSELETSHSLDILTARQLLSEEKDTYRFHHDLVRRATLAAISPVRLQILHARAGRALERFEPDAVTALAYHYDAGGELQKAQHYYEFSARNAEALFAWREAIAQYDRMLILLDRIDPQNAIPKYQKQRGRIFARLVLLNHNQGNLVVRNERLEQMDALVALSKDRQLELNYLLLRNRYLHLDGKFTEAVKTAERGLVLASEIKDSNAYCRLLAQIGFISFFLGQPDVALAKLEAAKDLTDHNHDLELRANVMGRLAFVKSLFGKYQEALEHQKEAHACYEQLGNHYFAAQHLTEIGDLYACLGLFEESHRALKEILELARKTNLRYDEGHALLAMGGLHACQGEYESAVQVYREALDILYTMQSHHLTATAEAALGVAYYHLGDYVKSQACLEQGLARSRSIKFPIRVAHALIMMARVEIATHNIDLAKEYLAEGLAIARATQSVELIITGLVVTANLDRRNRNLPEALANIEEALQHTGQIDLPVFEMWARAVAGLILQELNQPEAALAHSLRAIQLIPQATQDWIQHEQVLLTYARLLRCSGELDAAQEQVQKARALHQAKAAQILDSELRQQFNQAFENELMILTP